MTPQSGTGPEPPAGCSICPRLIGFRAQNRQANPDWHNDVVESFGDDDARLLIVGLAPGLKGANRTGRPFTGDYAGDLLYPTLVAHGLATGRYGRRPDDSLRLNATMITNAVRCVPPKNKPTGPEIANCRRFLLNRIHSMPNLRVILVLGRIAHDSTLRALGLKQSAHKFIHGARYDLNNGHLLIDSYHCSRYNLNTRRLTENMFNDVVATAAKIALG